MEFPIALIALCAMICSFGYGFVRSYDFAPAVNTVPIMVITLFIGMGALALVMWVLWVYGSYDRWVEQISYGKMAARITTTIMISIVTTQYAAMVGSTIGRRLSFLKG